MSATRNWIAAATPMQRRVLLAASLGWMLDSMDVMLYSLVLSEVQRELQLSTSTSGLLMSFTLISAAIGGICFGWIADRIGRTRALTASMLIYSVFTGLCGLVHSVPQLALCRILLGLGMGGEWASGASLVAETWPDKDRAKALAVVQSSWAIGYALGAILTALIMPTFGWRAVFFAGVIPALLTVWIRRSIKEPEMWHQRRQASPPVRELFHGELGRSTLVTLSMNAATLFAWWGLFTWIPRFLSLPIASGGHGLPIVQTSSWTVLMQVGTFLGYVSFGYFADTFGRKRTYIAYLLMAAALVPIYTHAPGATAVLLLGPLVGFFGTGYFSGFSIITSELFPTALRATAMGLVYNTGRFASAGAPYMVGYLAERHGMGAALSTISIAFLFAALVATRLRETRNQALA